jgi:hypothetical protein
MQLKGEAMKITIVILCVALALFANGQNDLSRTNGTAIADPGCNPTTQKQWWDFVSDSMTCETDGGGGGGGVPAGAVVMIVSGSCSATLGAGWSEEATLNGTFVVGTLDANANIGTTGGNDNVTPTGTVSQPTFTGNSSSVIVNHTHTVDITDPGHTHVQGVNSATTGGTSGYTPDTSTNTRVNSGYSTSSGTTGITATTQNPGGGSASYTPSGTVSQPTFTGNSLDNRPAFTRVIFCKKT